MKNILLYAAFIAASFTGIAQVGIGTTTPHASAALEIESTTKGLLPPRMTLVQINAIATPVEGLMVYCLDCTTKGLFVNNGTKFINITSGMGINTAVVDITGPGGGVWMDRNLGATQVAASNEDADSYGDLYQWGRDSDGHESRTSATTATTAASADAGHGDFILGGIETNYNWTDFVNEDTLWQLGLNDPCPTGYRIPTEAEFQNEIDNFSPNNAAGAFLALKLPLAGFRSYSNGSLNAVGYAGYGKYWSSTGSSTSASHLVFNSSDAGMNVVFRANGLSVRCIKE
jgi:uncharacterized protein (TIGR02145 family)